MDRRLSSKMNVAKTRTLLDISESLQQSSRKLKDETRIRIFKQRMQEMENKKRAA